MASYPPPPPPPYGQPPFRYDARKQQRYVREQMRAQVRAQRDAFKAQRELYREQARGLRRSSILGPLFLLAAGIVALLVSSGRVSFGALAAWYAHWWPLLIVAAGVLLLAEWGFDQWRAEAGTPYARRALGGGAVFFLILLISLGLTATGASHTHVFGFDGNNYGYNFDSSDFSRVFGQRYDREQTIDHAMPAGTTLALDNPHGDVTITGKSADDAIHIVVSKELYGTTEHDADNMDRELTPTTEMVGNVLRVNVPRVNSGHCDLSITVPEKTQMTVSATHGDVRLSGVMAPVDVTTSHGDIELNAIGGNVTAHVTSSGSSFTAHHVVGDVSMKGRADNIALTDVTGQTTLDGEFYGDTHMERLGGPMTFHTSRTHLQLAKLDGEVDISPDSALSGSDITGPTQLRTRSRNISLERVNGRLDVSNTNGSVDLINVLPLGNITVENKDGQINVTVPTQSGLTVDANVRDGHIDNDLALQAVTENDNAELHGTVGNGANHLSLRTSHAEISIRKAVSAVPAVPSVPAAPAVKTAKPGVRSPATI